MHYLGTNPALKIDEGTERQFSKVRENSEMIRNNSPLTLSLINMAESQLVK